MIYIYDLWADTVVYDMVYHCPFTKTNSETEKRGEVVLSEN